MSARIVPRWACALALLFGASVPLAWGAAGHEIVAAIAEQRLSPAGRELVDELTGGKALSSPEIATWADAQRDPARRRWHYVNIPLQAGHYDKVRDCQRGCVVEALRTTMAELAGPGSHQERAIALRWVVHLVADIHQPLHAGDGQDRGGNDFLVLLGRRKEPVPFHRVWDVEVLRPLARRGAREVARELGGEIPAAAAAKWALELDPAQWAEESSQVTREMYAELGRRPGQRDLLRLPAAYLRAQQGRVGMALQKAGVRLAAVLNRAGELRESAQ